MNRRIISALIDWMPTSSITRRHAGFASVAIMCLLCCSRVAGGQEAFGSGRELSVEALGFPRTRTVLSGRGLRVFAGRGSASLLDKTVTGVQWLTIPPVILPNYRFLLSFRDEGTGTLIRDAGWQTYEYLDITRRSMPLPLGMNFSPEWVTSVLPQKSEWRPNEFLRTGTFHRYLKGRWVSFGVETRVRASPNSDEILMQVRLTNRDQAPLNLTVLPEQTLFEVDLPAVPGIVVDPAPKFTQPDAYTLRIGTPLR